MSALHLKAVEERTSAHVSKVPKATWPRSLDHLVGPGEDAVWDDHAERLGPLEVDLKLKLCRLLYWQVSRMCALEYPIDVDGRLPPLLVEVWAVAQQPAHIDKVVR